MTKRERAQVVELLRCAADNEVCDRSGRGLGNAAEALELLGRIPGIGGDGHWTLLLDAMRPFERHEGDVWHVSGTGYEWCLLELALRVEQGEWP